MTFKIMSNALFDMHSTNNTNLVYLTSSKYIMTLSEKKLWIISFRYHASKSMRAPKGLYVSIKNSLS